jgi:predicted flap endonuclease-1-like 5' DNA nuclease
LGEIDRQIRSAKKRRRRLQRKQGRLRAAEVKRREKLEQRLKQSQSAEAVDLQHLDQKLQADLARVQRRRDQVRQVGVDAVNKLQAKHATYLASLDNQIGGLRQLEEAELAQTLKRRQQQFVAAYMKRQTIEAAIIPGIGPAAKESLRKQGILRAQDLEAPRLAQIEGIGEAKARVLLEWRRKAESLALQASPQNLSKIEETLIRGRFFQRRFALEQEKVKAQRKLAKDVTAAQEQNAGQLKAIDQEPQTLRTRAAQQRDAIRKRHQGQRTQWQSALSALNGAGQATGMSPEETLVEQELALLTAQRSSAELRLRRYESLAFGSYVRRVVGMR